MEACTALRNAGDAGPHRKPPATAKGQNVILRDSSLSLFSSLRCSCSARKLRNGPAHQRQERSCSAASPARASPRGQCGERHALLRRAVRRVQSRPARRARCVAARFLAPPRTLRCTRTPAGDPPQVSARATHRVETCDGEQDALARCGILLVRIRLAFLPHRAAPARWPASARPRIQLRFQLGSCLFAPQASHSGVVKDHAAVKIRSACGFLTPHRLRTERAALCVVTALLKHGTC